MDRVNLQPAYLLFTRPYRENSLLVDLFSEDHGRVSMVYRGGRSRKRRSALREFLPLLVSWSGRAELKNLNEVENDGLAADLTGNRLYSGLYANELLYRLLQPFDAHPRLFYAYGELLAELQTGAEIEVCLRCFEFRLLEEIGYGLEFRIDAESGIELQPASFYAFEPEKGFSACDARCAGAIPGADLIAIAAGQWQDKAVKKTAKSIARQALAPHLGDRPLKSRELFARTPESRR